MPYRLANALWCCRTAEHLVFLDIHGDRYFRLSPAAEQAFDSYLLGGPTPDTSTLPGLRRFETPSSRVPYEEVESLPQLDYSPLEDANTRMRARPSALLEVTMAIAVAQLRLRLLRLDQVLAGMCSFREKRASPAYAGLPASDAARLVQAARTFSATRLYVPLAPCCLLDSVALTMFLARRNLYAHVVFGITVHPFSAHSWVQVGDMVLNDSVGNASAYTPIGVF